MSLYLNLLKSSTGNKLLKPEGAIIRDNIRDIDLGVRCREIRFTVVLTFLS